MNLKLWSDLMKPPPMNEVINTVKTCLKRDLYHILDDEEDLEFSNSEKLTSSTDSENESAMSDSSSGKEIVRPKFKKHQVKLDSKAKKEELTQVPEAKPQDAGDTAKTNVDDLVEKIG
jgi:hypothetical protein